MLTSGERPAAALLVGGPVRAPQQRLPALAGRGIDAVEDDTKPLMLGYLRRELLVTDGQVEAVQRELARFAQDRGFCMGFTYVEQRGTWPAAFEALVEAVNRYVVTAVVLPSLLHFAALGAPTVIRDSLERATRARILVAQSPH